MKNLNLTKKIYLLLVVNLFLLLMVFFLYQRKPSPLYDKKNFTFQESATFEKVIKLTEQNSSGQKGEAIVKEVGGSVVVLLRLENSPQSLVQPAFVHQGTCENLGGKKYYLAGPINGKSTTTWYRLSMDHLMGSLPLAIVVIDPEGNVIAVCGELLLEE